MKSLARSSCSTLSATLCALALAGCAGTKPDPAPPRPIYTPPTQAPALAAKPPAESKPTVDAAQLGQQGQAGQPSAATTPAGATALAAEAPSDLVLATVGGKAIRASDLMQHWMARNSRELWEYFYSLMDARYAELEAERMGITLEPELVDAAVIDVRMAIEQKIEEVQPGMGFERYIRNQHNMTPESYMEGIRQNQIRGLLLERVVRTWLLTQERAELRVIIVTNEELGAKVTDALAAGNAFEDVAREFSEDTTRESGGRMPPVIRSEELMLSSIAFGNEVGGVTGPIEDNGRLMWVQTTGFPKPLSGTWSVLEPTISASLKEEELNEYEFIQWKTFIEAGYEVEAETFLELIGQGSK